MPRRLTSAICAAIILLVGAPIVRAAPPDPSNSAQTEASERVERAIAAWRKGEWTEVRDLLEPLVREDEGIEDQLLRESALRYLAEATLLDEGLEPSDRRELARSYVGRLLESTPDWAPPSGLHGRAYYDLVAQIRSERDSALAEACRGRLLACEADLTELEVDHATAQGDFADLEAKFEAEEVAVTEIIKRNRGLALLPLGVGHFTNDNYALGGTFLALEITAGATALGLLIYRIAGLGCVRTAGFASKSLVCIVPVGDEALPATKDHIERVRSAETIMGYVFVGSVLVDIALAQALFKPITIIERDPMPRSKLREQLEGDATPEAERRKQRRPSARLELRPHPTHVPRGLGFGVTLQF